MVKSAKIILIITVLVYCIYCAIFWNYSIDDAFITFRYAENLADGHGLVFNVSDSPLEGYSNFLWLLILAFLFKLGFSTYLSAKIIGIISMPLSAIILTKFDDDNQESLNLLTGPLFLIAPITAFWGLSGLELGLHALLLTLTMFLLIRRSGWLFALLPFLVISRPEGVALGIVMVAASALSDHAGNRPGIKFHLLALGILMAALGGLTIFRWIVFGYLLPNTYWAKIHHEWQIGFIVLGRMLVSFAPLTLLLLGALYLVIREKLRYKLLTVFVAVFIAQALISARMDPVMNFLSRYMIMVLPFFIGAGMLVLNRFNNRLLARAAVLVVLLSLLWQLPKVNRFVKSTDLMIEAQNQVVDWAQNLPPGTTISMSDMGRIPHATRQIHYYDIYGLVNETVAHKGFYADREFNRLPDYFILVGYIDENDQLKLIFWREQNLAYNERFKTVYKPIKTCVPEGYTIRDPGYYYFIFKRVDLPG